jgi:pimeloyl-ACP methyl ester carboxylesterase
MVVAAGFVIGPSLRSFEPQLRHFGKRYRVIAFNARGFPSSDVPESPASYSQARAPKPV